MVVLILEIRWKVRLFDSNQIYFHIKLCRQVLNKNCDFLFVFLMYDGKVTLAVGANLDFCCRWT